MQTTACSLLPDLANVPSNHAIRFKKFKTWHSLNFKEYKDLIEKIHLGLKKLNIEKGDRVGILSATRYEWAAADWAILSLGGITVPIYHTSTSEEIKFIIQNSQLKIIFLENKKMAQMISSIKDQCPDLKKLIIFEILDPLDEDNIALNELCIYGETLRQQEPQLFANNCKSIQLSDPATIVYTSGTTGIPKGVVLTHEQIMSEITEAFSLFKVDQNDRSLSFLPYSHVLGRIEHWAQPLYLYEICFAESLEKIRDNLLEVRPTFFMSVPRIFEKIYSAIWTAMENQKIKRILFTRALEVAKEVSSYQEKAEPIPLRLFAEYKIAEKVVLSKVKEAFGGQLRFAISGGAPLSDKISRFFYSCGVMICQGYGLTETTAAVTVNTPFNFRLDTVGIPIGDTKIKIAEDGEILIKSKKVMKEYYKNPEATKEAFQDGWYCTGDIGELTSSGHLRITDRKKDMIKTAGGKYVAPQKIENLFKQFPLISYVHVHGDEKKYIVCLFTLDKARAIQIAQAKNIDYRDLSSLMQSPAIYEEVRKIVAEINSILAHHETIKKFAVINDELSVEGGELTPSLKVKRKAMDKKYKDLIEKLY